MIEISLCEIELAMQTKHTQSYDNLVLQKLTILCFCFIFDQSGEILQQEAHNKASKMLSYVKTQINVENERSTNFGRSC